MKLNKLLSKSSDTYLYNFDLVIDKQILDNFSNAKYIFMQGSMVRAKVFATKLAAQILNIDPEYFEPLNLLPCKDFCAYKIGNVLSVSHGMGNSSMLILLHTLTKLLHYAGNTDLEYIRLGTSGGIGINPGTVVLTNTAYMPNLVPGYMVSVLDQDIIYPTEMNKDLNNLIIKAQPDDLDFKIALGNSIAADDFYLGQARLDGAIKPHYDESRANEYFTQVQKFNILNFEMESTSLASFCYRAEIPATMIAVTLVNRLLSDQITATPEMLSLYSDRPQHIALNYLKYLDIKG